MRKEKIYSIAYRKRDHQEDFFWLHDNYVFKEAVIDNDGRYWFADPFLFERNGSTYLFYEAFDLIERKGKIGYSIIAEDGSFSKPRIIINEKCHLSFPNIFEYNDTIYIMPESSEDYRVKLFKATDFPDRWEEADVILPDVYACDSVIMEKDNERFLLANEMYHNTPNGLYCSCWLKNYLYRLDGFAPLNDGVKVAEGDLGIRNAGSPFLIGNTMYRMGQDCTGNNYGKGLVLFQIESCSPYKEQMVWAKDCYEIRNHIHCKDMNSIIGVHTYNMSGKYEVIDYTQDYRITPYMKIRRKLWSIQQRLIKQ